MNDLDFLLEDGLESAYLTTGTLYSILTKSPVLTHKLVPTLSGICDTKEGLIPLFVVDEIPAGNQVAGVILKTVRKTEDDEAQSCYLIQVQQASQAWQIMALEDALRGKGFLSNRMIFASWKSGSFAQAVERHHDLVRKLDAQDLGLDIDSDLVRVGMSSFMLSNGLSTIAQAMIADPWFQKALDNPGKLVVVESSGLINAKCIAVDWEFREIEA